MRGLVRGDGDSVFSSFIDQVFVTPPSVHPPPSPHTRPSPAALDLLAHISADETLAVRVGVLEKADLLETPRNGAPLDPTNGHEVAEARGVHGVLPFAVGLAAVLLRLRDRRLRLRGRRLLLGGTAPTTQFAFLIWKVGWRSRASSPQQEAPCWRSPARGFRTPSGRRGARGLRRTKKTENRFGRAPRHYPHPRRARKAISRRDGKGGAAARTPSPGASLPRTAAITAATITAHLCANS